jgi:crotonobetaine/carnitine-CoA ligase
MLTHRYWLTIAKVAASRGFLGPETKNILIESPFFYMDPQWMTLLAMQIGAQLFVSRRGSLTKFMGWLRDYEIHYTLWPGRLPAEKEPDFNPSNHLRMLSTFGEFIGKPDRHAELERKFQTLARESFGMTEIGSGMYMPLEAVEKAGTGSCGIPSPFREAKIIDETGNELGDDEIGELCVRGPGIMLGYYKKPEANAKSLVDGWFRTGDLFRRDKDGFYYIVGRIKDMIRLNGEYIAAREVESVVDELPEVLESAAIGVKVPQRGEEVLIAVVTRDGLTKEDLKPEAIIEHCERHLASFKVPRYIRYCSVPLPRTASGKIAKHLFIKDTPDLTAGTFDRIENRWV